MSQDKFFPEYGLDLTDYCLQKPPSQILGFNCSIPEITQKVTYPENSKG